MSCIKIISLFLVFFQSISLLFGRHFEQRIYIDFSATRQKIESFGTSSCWWAQSISDSETAQAIAKALYDDETGLGLDVYRYNIGAGEKDNPNCRIWDVNRRTESFYCLNEATGEYEYDFTRDANARRMLECAVKCGATQVILFCNSPHFSMTESGHASGGLETNSSNLARENYGAFVDYVLTIADWFVSQGYPISAISPINEPQWSWGGEWVGQEGCHYTAAETVELLELFAVTMQERNCPYKLNGPESGEMSEAYREYLDRFFESDILSSFCDSFSGHSYWMDGNDDGKREEGKAFAEKYPDKKYEMSEWCELPQTIDPTTVESGLYMANVILSDLTLMNAVSWQSWTAVNGDGLLDLQGEQLTYYNRYYAFKQFSAFIEKGMQRLETYDSYGDDSTVRSVAFSNGEKTVVIMINNSESGAAVMLRGKGFKDGMTETFVTDAKRNCEKIYSGGFLQQTELPAKSITTVVISNLSER